jgi:hypothetical protein
MTMTRRRRPAAAAPDGNNRDLKLSNYTFLDGVECLLHCAAPAACQHCMPVHDARPFITALPRAKRVIGLSTKARARRPWQVRRMVRPVPRLRRRRLVLPSRHRQIQMISVSAQPSAGNPQFCDALGVWDPFIAGQIARSACGSNTRSRVKLPQKR